ncbi:MAG TPA: hypothetical protein VI011_25305 [Asanoa sp.]|jgi:hypothetical protein
MDQPPEIVAAEERTWDRPILTVPVLAFLSLVGGQLPSFSTRANLYTISLGGALIWLGLSNRMPRRPSTARFGAGTAWWLVPVAVFGVFEGSTYLAGSSPDFPTFSKLTDPLLDDQLVRSAAYFAWLSAFWGLVRR